MKRRSIILAFAAGVVLAAPLPFAAQEAQGPGLAITGGFLRASPAVAGAGAGFMTIRATGAGDVLTGFRSPACARPELHTHVMDNGMMRMRQVPQIDVPAGGAAVLQPGGLHLMFIDLVAPLKEGDQVPVTLIFQNAGEVEITLPVKGPGAMN